MAYLAPSDFTTPLMLFVLDLNVMELTVMRRQPQQFDSDGINVQQSRTTSADDECIPYFHVGKNAAPDTSTLVYAYGGFSIPESPHYLDNVGKYWLEEGNAFVLANIRGGGEFGPRWYQAAQDVSKHKSIDDLLATVHDLSERGMSSPQHIGLQGGSNGGLITAAAFVREPQSIGALVCEVPLTDMIRYPLLSTGLNWTDEYGNPQKYEVYKRWLGELPPYHNLSDNINYPPALITTSLSDDHVHPAHVFKFYAKLRGTSPQSWLYSSDDGGHTGNGTQRESADGPACVLLFLKEFLGQK